MTTEAGAGPAFKTELVGEENDPVEFAVDREKIAAYAAATNDSIAPHAAGDIAPPVFAVVPAFGSAVFAAIRVIPAELLGHLLHGEQDFHFHRPIEPGMKLETRSKVIGTRQRRSGATVTVLAECRDETGELVNSQYMTSFIRGATGVEDKGEEAPPHGMPDGLSERDPDAEVAQTYDADQTYRYKDASGDENPIHVDDEFAKNVGLPGIIIHGLCTMAFTSVAVLESFAAEDPTRLRRLAVRFSSMAFPEQTITTRIWNAGAREERTAYAFETTSDAGATVIKDGWAELA